MELNQFSSYKISKELNLIICNYQGFCTIKDVIALNKLFTADPDFNLNYNVFIDFSDSKAIAFRIELNDFIDFFTKSIKLEKKVRVGSLYITPNQKFLLKVYKSFGRMMNVEIENFNSFDNYISWMNFNNDQKSQLKEILKSIKSNMHDRR